MRFKNIAFNDIFELKRGQVISKEYIVSNKGEYPVFSTQQNSPFGLIDSFDYDGEFLIWNTDGLAGYIRHLSGRFSITNIVGILLYKDDTIKNNIDLDYLRFYLEPIFRKHRKGRLGENEKNEYSKLNSTMIKNLNIQIPLPVDKFDNFDVLAQKNIIKEFLAIEKQKKKIITQKEKIKSCMIDLSDSIEEKQDKKLLDLVHILPTSYLSLGCKLLTSMNTDNVNDYSVWSAAKNPIAYIKENIEGKLINASEEEKVLSISTNGDGSAGRNLYIHSTPFYIDSGRIAIVPKPGIDIKFLYFSLLDMKQKYGFNRGKPVNKKTLQEVFLTIPVMGDNEPNLLIQHCISSKYEELHAKRDYMLSCLDIIIKADIQLDWVGDNNEER